MMGGAKGRNGGLCCFAASTALEMENMYYIVCVIWIKWKRCMLGARTVGKESSTPLFTFITFGGQNQRPSA